MYTGGYNLVVSGKERKRVNFSLVLEKNHLFFLVILEPQKIISSFHPASFERREKQKSETKKPPFLVFGNSSWRE